MAKKHRTRKKKVITLDNALKVFAILIAISFVVLLVYGGIQGWFRTIVNNNISYPTSLNQFTSENKDDSYSIMLSLNPPDICVGDETTGSINSNMPNGLCAIFTNVGSGYKYLQNAMLNSQGKYSSTQMINSIGTARFKAICVLNNRYQLSNEATLTVTACAEPQPTYNCFDSDDGINYAIYGNCQDSYHNLGYSDVCVNGLIKEYYCDDNGICQYIFGGKCPKDGQMVCSAITMPTSQAMCDTGYCDTGSCKFIPATLVTPAKCGCG